jgi:hypothetical protein
MQQHRQRNSTVFGAIAICTSVMLVGITYWMTGPGVNEFNGFNDRVFGPYYTAGAILMIGFYGLAFFTIFGVAAVATVIVWIRKGQPRWLAWTATIVTIAAPVIAVNILKGG